MNNLDKNNMFKDESLYSIYKIIDSRINKKNNLDNNDEEEIKQLLQGCMSLKRDKKDYCIRHLAKESHNEKYCQYIDDANIKDFCYIDVAVQKKDETICENVKDKNNSILCNSSVDIEKRYE